MNIRQLEYFVAVAEELNFRRAASRLHIAQPSLSDQIRQLESSLGARLFDRSVRPVELTPAGRRLLDDAHDHLERLDRTTRAIGRTTRGEDGELRIGFIHGGLYQLVLTALRSFRRSHPDVGLTLQQLPASEQIRALRARQVDVVIARVMEPLTDPDLVIDVLREEVMIGLVSEDHPLGARESIRLTELAADPFVMFPRRLEPLTFDRYMHACLDAGFSPRIDHEVTDAMTQALAVGSGLGVALSGAGLAFRFSGIAYVSVDPPKPLTQFAVITSRHSRAPLVEGFCTVVREAAHL